MPSPRFFSLTPLSFFSFRLSRSPFLSVLLCVCVPVSLFRSFFSLPARASLALARAVETTHGAPALAVPLAYSGLPGPGWGKGSPSWPRRARPGLARSGSRSPPSPPGTGRRGMASVWAVGPPGLERGPWRVRLRVVCLSKSLCAFLSVRTRACWCACPTRRGPAAPTLRSAGQSGGGAAAPYSRAVSPGSMGWDAVGAPSPPPREGQPKRRGRRVGKSFRGGGHGSPPLAAPPERERSPGRRGRTETFPHPRAGPPAGLGRRRGARSPRGAGAAHFAPGVCSPRPRESRADRPDARASPSPSFLCVCLAA